jgi:hypothetical protein
MTEHLDEDDDEPLTAWDRFVWYSGAASLGMIIAIFASAATDSGLMAILAWPVWMLCVWLLAKVGFWDWFEQFVLLVWTPFGFVFGILGKLLGGLFDILGKLLGGILMLAIVAFVVLGIAGLLWFGIRQLF